MTVSDSPGETLSVGETERLAVNSEVNNRGTVANAGTVALTGGLSQARQTAAVATPVSGRPAVTGAGGTAESQATTVAAIALPDSRRAVTVVRLDGEFRLRRPLAGSADLTHQISGDTQS